MCKVTYLTQGGLAPEHAVPRRVIQLRPLPNHQPYRLHTSLARRPHETALATEQPAHGGVLHGATVQEEALDQIHLAAAVRNHQCRVTIRVPAVHVIRTTLQ